MITGNDIAFWFSDLWFDLTNLSDVAIPSLLGRLALLVIVVLVAKKALGFVWRVLYFEIVRPIFLITWNLLSFPIRLPLNMVRRWRHRRAQKTYAIERAERMRHEAEQQKRAEEQRQEEKRREIVAETVRLQKAMRID